MRIWTDRTMVHGDKASVRRVDIDGTQDMYSALERALSAEKKGKRAKSKESTGSACEIIERAKTGNGCEFNGCSLDEFYERKYNWPGGLNEISRLSELNAMLHATKFEKRWSDYDGDSMDVERYYNEQPFLSRRVKTHGGNRRGQYRIVVNLCENSNVNSKNMLWKAYAATRLCDEIESQGNRVEVVIGSFYSHCIRGYDYTWVQCVGKRAQDPVNQGLLCTLMSPWMLRIPYFAILYHYNDCHYRLGHAHTVREYLGDDVEKHAVVIDTGDCLSHEAADVFIRTLDIGTEYEMDVS